MLEYTVPSISTIALFPLQEFYGFDHPHYLDIFMEFGEDREKLTRLIANAIVQRVHSNPAEFREMLAMQLGYMGIASIEENEFFEKFISFVNFICVRCSPRLVGTDLKLINVVEDTEWVNVIYVELLEPTKCVSQPQSDLINKPGSLSSTRPDGYMPKYSARHHITILGPGAGLTM